MEINGKVIFAIIILFVLFVSTLGIFALNGGNASSSSSDSMAGHHSGNSVLTNTQTEGQYGDLPEKCRLPYGQDVNSWKEHLGHHEDLQECLKYFN